MADEKAAKKTNKGLIGGIIAAVVAVIVIIVVVALNSGSKVVGKYNLSAFIDKDGNESSELLELLTAFGGKYTIEFKKDNTGVIEMSADDDTQTIKFTYTKDKIKFEEGEDGETTPDSDYTYKDDTVTITYEDQGMKFTREK